ncbi:TetR family transcriptional regulator [Herbihabitans rhizosphaerae]|uniref:TetR family transcriptional regulator n=1 Tax=Herbihabitans rhizosphaerae TaxID=1872711 RepID=A0A4Q7KHF1_9PSEU|nr:TetR/AcrR family transcriptional regulator [Herbihabitans rhizosphaerae]RZS32288.1 TetR family transcriptional regulator [Herbihabitans rhizosphaerae]
MRTVNPEQHAARRAAILRAAADEFAEAGVDGTSTSAICKRAGIGSGTLFHYFPTKRDIVHALFAAGFERNAGVCERALAEKSAEDGFRLLVDNLVADLGNPHAPGLTVAALLQAIRDDEFAEKLDADQKLTRDTLAALLRRRSGTPPVFSPERTAAWILRVVNATYMSAGEPGFVADEEIAELRRLIDSLAG